jgi:arylsulfatase A-like enzyme
MPDNGIWTRFMPANLLFIMTDQQRWDTLGLAGNTVLDTPNLDRLGRQGAYLERFYSARPICVPARSAILTGCSPQTTGIFGNGDYVGGDPKVVSQTTFDRVLHAEGYYTRYHGKWHTPDNLLYHEDGITPVYDNPDVGNSDHNVLQIGARPGQKWSHHGAFHAFLQGECPYGLTTSKLDYQKQQDPGKNRYVNGYYQAVYEALPSDVHLQEGSDEFGRLLLPPEYSRTAYDTRLAMQALDDAAARQQPFAITLSIGPPHAPMIAPEPFFSQFPAADMPVPASINDDGRGQPYPPADGPFNRPAVIRDMKQCYYALVKEVDYWVGQLLDRLDALGLASNTLVVFTSDHGEMLGDHGRSSKSVLYEGACRVPGLLRLPGVIPAGTTVRTPAGHIDLFPTILDYLQVMHAPVDGSSIRPLIEHHAGPGGHGDYCVVEECVVLSDGRLKRNSPMYAVRSENWKLIMAENASSLAVDALYDMSSDPGEMDNLLASNDGRARHRETSEALRSRLVDYLGHIRSPFADTIAARSLEPLAAGEASHISLDFNAHPGATDNGLLFLLPREADGQTVAAEMHGRHCRSTANPDKDHVFCFGLMGWLGRYTDNRPLVIECDFWAPGPRNQVCLRYLGAEGISVHPEKRFEARPGSWHTARWRLDDARFQHKRRSGIDFLLIFPQGERACLSAVRLIADGPH